MSITKIYGKDGGLEFLEGIDFYLMDRPVGGDKSVLDSTDVTGYTLKIYDVTETGGPGTEVDSETTGGLTEFAAAQLDGYWTKDPTGYYFRLKVDPTAWTTPAEGGKLYRIELLYTSTLWRKVMTVWMVSCVATDQL